MPRIAVVDDQPDMRQQLCSMIDQYSRENNCMLEVTAFSDGAQVITNYCKGFDIIFLDVEMKRLNGMETAQRIRELDDSTRLARIQLIVHCVGDMHCPAHIRYPGNTTIGYYKVDYFGREMRYHTIWDSEIVQRPHPWSFTDLAWLLDRYTEAEQAEITSGTVYDWGRESAAASKCIYDVQPGESIANDFIKKYKPLAESQIAKAGYRLAAVLNDVFGK